MSSLTKVKGSVLDWTVDTIADLLSAPKGQVVQVLGYHERGDGGGGVFFYDETEDKANHNGGTVISPSATYPSDWNNQTQLTTWFDGDSGLGCWKREYSGAVNVKWFGDNIQEALDFSLIVELSNDVLISSPLIIKDSQTLFSKNNSKIYTNSSISYLLTQQDAIVNNINISGITFDGVSLNTGNSLIYFNKCRNVSISNCIIKNSATNGVWFFNDCNNIKIENNTLDNFNLGAIVVEGDSVGESGLPTTETISAIIKNNKISNCVTQNGIFIAHAVQDVIIEGNFLSTIGDCAIEVGGLWGAYGVKNATISNNIGKTTSGNNGAFIYVRRSENVSVVNNTGYVNFYGLHIDSSSKVTGNNNIFVDSEYSCKLYNSSACLSEYISQNSTTKYSAFIDHNVSLSKIKLIDKSSILQTISLQSDNQIEAITTVKPIIEQSNRIGNLNIKSLDGYVKSNISTLNLIPNSLFINDDISKWGGNASSKTASNNILTVFGYEWQDASVVLYDGIKNLPNVLYFSFDYENTGNGFLAISGDSTSFQTYSLSSTTGVTSFKCIINFTNYQSYNDLVISFFPSISGGSSTMKLKNLMLSNNENVSKFGHYDLVNMEG